MLRGLSANLIREAIKAAARQVVVDGPSLVWFVEAVEDAEDHCSQSDAGDFDDSLREFELSEVGVDFSATDVLAELLTAIEQLHTGKVTTPFIVEWAVVRAAVCDPELGAVKGYGVW